MAVEVLTDTRPVILECGTSGFLHYRSRDIGYGVEEGTGEAMFCGPAHGKLMFAPDDSWSAVGDGTLPGAPTRPVYLFDDEIVEWSRVTPTPVEEG